MESLWIAYYRITFYKNKSLKAAGQNETSPEGTNSRISPKDKNYEYNFQCAEEDNDELFKSLITKTQSKAKSYDDIDIVCKIEVKRKRTTGIKNEILEINVYDCEIYKEPGERKENGILLGTITTDITSIGKDIAQIALMGSGITRSRFKTITKLVEVNYPLIIPDTGNWNSEQAKGKNMENILHDSILTLYAIYEDYKGSKDTDATKHYKETEGLFLISVSEFKSIYNDMEISEYLSIRDYKKYLKDNAYIKTNPNRYDYTDASLGKCIALDIKKIKKFMGAENSGLEKNNNVPEAR